MDHVIDVTTWATLSHVRKGKDDFHFPPCLFHTHIYAIYISRGQDYEWIKQYLNSTLTDVEIQILATSLFNVSFLLIFYSIIICLSQIEPMKI